MTINQNSTRSIFVRFHPLWVALFFYWLITILLLITSLPFTPGRLGYPLDDTYIHMAIARNFVQHDVWGVSPLEFSSSTSSPLWTFLTAISFWIFGIRDWLPAVINLIAGTATIILGYSILKDHLAKLHLSVVLVLIVILSILPVLTLMGMEHTLHTYLTLAVLYLTRKTFVQPSKKHLVLLSLTGALLPVTRYESIFTCLGIFLIFIFLKKWKQGFAFALASLLPITLYGIISVTQGWYFFPNSVLLKGNLPQLSSGGLSAYFLSILERLTDAPHLFILVLAALFLLSISTFQKKPFLSQLPLGLWAWTALLHLAFAKTAWFYRYEAYLIFPGFVFIAENLSGMLADLRLEKERSEQLPQVLLLVISLILAALPSILRAGNAMRDYPLAVKNNYDQQYQMARFIQKYYPDGPVAISDIGAVSYFSDTRFLDLWGLGSREVAQEKLGDTYDKASLSSLAQENRVKMAILYPYLYEEILPDSWEEVGRWQIRQNVVSAFDTVAIYATDQSGVSLLIDQLKTFGDQLPEDVIQSGQYVE